MCETAWHMQEAAGGSGLMGQELAGDIAGAVMGEVKEGLDKGWRVRPSTGRAYSHSPSLGRIVILRPLIRSDEAGVFIHQLPVKIG